MQDRKPGPKHEAIGEDELKNKKLMRSMKAAGLSGQMYNRDNIMQQMQDLQEQADDADFPTHKLEEVGEQAAAAGSSVQDTVKAAVGTVTDAATKVVDQAGSFIKNAFGKLSSSVKGADKDTKPANEL